MKIELKIAIEETVLLAAKLYAKQQGVSLSQLTEAALSEVANRRESTFSERWRGTFEPGQKEDERFQSLAKKYLA